MTARTSLVVVLALLALLALAPVDLSAMGLPYPGLKRYGTYILTLWLVTAIAAMGVNLIVGYAGQETLAQAAFIAAIVGGFNQVRGAIAGGLLIGVLDNLAAAYVSTQYRAAVPLIFLIVVILFRPQGLLGRAEERTV